MYDFFSSLDNLEAVYIIICMFSLYFPHYVCLYIFLSIYFTPLQLLKGFQKYSYTWL